MKETVSKYVKHRNRKEKRKQPRKKKGVMILNNENPKQPFKCCSVFSPGGF
jgi:hypothetical protein